MAKQSYVTPESLLQDLIRQYLDLGLPVPSDKINRSIRYTRSTRNLGSCSLNRTTGLYTISLSAYAMKDEKEIRATLAHELVHTLPGCMSHGTRFHAYGSIVEHHLGIPITSRADRESAEKSGITDARMAKARYKIICNDCGQAIYRLRRCKLTDYPESYRCSACGGRFTVYKRA